MALLKGFGGGRGIRWGGGWGNGVGVGRPSSFLPDFDTMSTVEGECMGVTDLAGPP